MIPKRTTAAKFAKSALYLEKNDVDIYIEDKEEGYEKIYSVLFSRVFEGKYKVGKVFPLGGRSEVENTFRSNKSNILRPSIFVVDGDLNLLIDDESANEPGFYSLPFYCIENLLICENAIIEIIDQEDIHLDKSDLEAKFNFTEWKELNENLLTELFIEYALSHKFNRDEQTVGFSINKLMSSNEGLLDEKKVKARIEDLSTKTREKIGQDVYLTEKQGIITRIEGYTKPKFSYISGKDYLFPLMRVRVRSIIECKMKDIVFKRRLASLCNIEYIIEAIDHIYHQTIQHDSSKNPA